MKQLSQLTIKVDHDVLKGANLTRADLDDVDLTEADLIGANLSKANLCYVNLSGADLEGADAHDARFAFINFTGASFAHSTGIDLIGVDPDQITPPEGYKLVKEDES